MIREEVIRRVLAELQGVTVWLKSILDGTIEVLRDVRDAAYWIADEMRRTFRTVGKEAVIANGMAPKRVYEEVFKMVKDAPLPGEVLGMMQRPVADVFEFLQGAGVKAAKAAEILVRTFVNVTKEALATAHKAGKYVPDEATRVAENPFLESGRAVENIRDEARRSGGTMLPGSPGRGGQTVSLAVHGAALPAQFNPDGSSQLAGEVRLVPCPPVRKTGLRRERIRHD